MQNSIDTTKKLLDVFYEVLNRELEGLEKKEEPSINTEHLVIYLKDGNVRCSTFEKIPDDVCVSRIHYLEKPVLISSITFVN